MEIRTLKDLEDALASREKIGCNHSHDEELFIYIMALSVHHPDKMVELFKRYMNTLSAMGKVQASKALTDFAEEFLNRKGE